MSTIQTLTDLEIAEVSGAGLNINFGALFNSSASSSFSFTKTKADGSSTSIEFDNSADIDAEGYFSLLWGKSNHCCCSSDTPATGV
jgi:hypothetical protein